MKPVVKDILPIINFIGTNKVSGINDTGSQLNKSNNCVVLLNSRAEKSKNKLKEIKQKPSSKKKIKVMISI